MSHLLERRGSPRQGNVAGQIADAHANARRMREVVEVLTSLALIGQLPSASDMQAALAPARITEFHTTRAGRSMENAVRIFEES